MRPMYFLLALREAIRLAKNPRAALRLIHVVDETLITWDESGAMGETATLLEALRQAGQTIADKARGVASIIVEEAKRWPADLIVIGTHGRRGVDRLLLGSVAEGVVRLSAKPVLLIRGAQEKGRKRT